MLPRSDKTSAATAGPVEKGGGPVELMVEAEGTGMLQAASVTTQGDAR